MPKTRNTTAEPPEALTAQTVAEAPSSAGPTRKVAKGPAPDVPEPNAADSRHDAAERLNAAQSAGSASEAADAAYEAHMLGLEQRQAIERLSLNLAKAALTAQGAIAEAALRHADRPAALSPDPFHVAPAMTEVMGRLAASPDQLFKAQADLFDRYRELWATTAQRALTGAPAEEPGQKKPRGDKRFSGAEWTENPVFDVMRQSYLITSEWLNGLVADVDGVDPLTKRRAAFFTKMLTDAFSPSNFLASNPVALNALLESGGESLVRGMENFAADLERGGGRLAIRQTDHSRFRVGENVATAPGQVVWRDELFELIQYAPTTKQVREIPLLIFPPWINKFYILDLRPENSMIRWLSSQGFTVFVCSWINPDAALKDRSFEDYMKGGIYRASEKVMEQCGTDKVTAVGYCIGGTLLGSTLAHMAATGDERIAAATFFAAQHDFQEAGDLLLFTDESWLAELEQRMDEAGGVLPGAAMADTFNALRANDLVWSFFVNNYLLGKEPPAFDLLYWNSDQTRMPKALHLFYLREFYGKNALAKGELVLDGVKLDLGKVKTPLFFQASREDHIAPAGSVYRSARLFGGPVTYMMAGSGHIAGVVNHPDAKKYQHWENDALPATLDEWRAQAIERPGSWWPAWAVWLHGKSGGLVPARDPAMGPLAAIEPAPGAYVKVSS